jgi:hypothetical protein
MDGAAPDAAKLGEEDTEIQPVYPPDAGPLDPLARRFCDAAVLLPAARRAECCHEPRGFASAASCAHALSYALTKKALSVAETALARCTAAAERALAGCAWVGPSGPILPEECRGIFAGKLGSGAPCRSSLECQANLFCHGLTVARAGICGSPKPKGAVCGGGIDTLVSYTRQTDYESAHAECSGYCLRGTCQEFVKAGERCEASAQCEGKAHCIGSVCSEQPLPELGKPCLAGQCAVSGRCIGGTCRAPLTEGQTCRSELECAGGCVKEPGKRAGKCGMVCEVPNILNRKEPRGRRF